MVLRAGGLATQLGNQFGVLAREVRIATDGVERNVLGYLEEPAAGIVGNAGIGPALQGANERFLHGFLCEFQVFGAEQAREIRNDLSCAAAEQIVDESLD